jgi:iron(III)-salmochelin esterase
VQVPRRTFSFGAAAALALACSKKREQTVLPPFRPSEAFASPSSTLRDSDASAPRFRFDAWSVGSSSGNGEGEVAVVYPTGRVQNASETRYPVLVALHGRGEAMKRPKDGALGWFRDYALMRALERVVDLPLTVQDFQDLITPERLRTINSSFRELPFGGLVIVCPYLPDLDLRKPKLITDYGRYLTDVLLPSVHAKAPTLLGVHATGIDGVSLGGAAALHIGFERPDLFGCVGAIQPAIQLGDAPVWATKAKNAKARNGAQKLRLLTSQKDYFRDGIYGLSAELKKAAYAHELRDSPGPHDYVFNQGPGAYELLFFHDRNLERAG